MRPHAFWQWRIFRLRQIQLFQYFLPIWILEDGPHLLLYGFISGMIVKVLDFLYKAIKAVAWKARFLVYN